MLNGRLVKTCIMSGRSVDLSSFSKFLSNISLFLYADLTPVFAAFVVDGATPSKADFHLNC